MRAIRKMTLVAVLALQSMTATAAIEAGKPTVLITGANRGIGLEFVRQLSARDWNVIATARKPEQAEQLQALADADANIVIEQLDVTDHERIAELAEKYRDQPIDILLNNAGLTPRYATAFKRVKGVDFDTARLSFEVNALGPLKMAQQFMPHVAASDQKKDSRHLVKGRVIRREPEAADDVQLSSEQGSAEHADVHAVVRDTEARRRSSR